MALLVYTENISNRKIWIFDHILKNILGIDYHFCYDKDTFNQHNAEKFTYGFEAIADELFLPQHAFINEVQIIELEIKVADYQNYKVPFPVKSDFLPFDIFSASFYLLSRYEEYVNKNFDEHRRFEAEESLAYQLNFLDKPVIDIWAFALLKKLQEKFPQIAHKKRQFKFIPTIDIDRPYYLKTEKALRKILKIGKNILMGRLSILLTDPFDTYDYMKELHQKHQLKPIFFFLVNDKHLFDGAPSVDNEEDLYYKLIKKLSANYQTGLHPSYGSNTQIKMLEEEKLKLENVLIEKVLSSRQHYLKLTLPDTYKNLLSINILNDYSMGYASQIGFRAATCTAFTWYDLENEAITNLKIHPFMVMDQTLRKYLQLNLEESVVEISKLIQEVKKVNGTFTSLWHNESLSNFGEWRNWRTVYEEMLNRT